MKDKRQRTSFFVNLSPEESEQVRVLKANGRKESEAVRAVLESRFQSLLVSSMTAPTLPEAPPEIPSITVQVDPPPKQVHDHADLNACAEQLILQLDDNWQVWIKEVADVVLKVPLWQIVAGTLLLACDRSEIPAAIIDPRWTEGGRDVVQNYVCKVCGVEFTPTRYAQPVCSNPCGSEYERRMANPERKAPVPSV